MKQVTTLLLFYFIPLFCAAQVADSSAFLFSTIENENSLYKKTQIYIDSSSSLSIEEVVQKPFSALENVKLRRKIRPEMINYTFYLKIFLQNDTDTTSQVYLFPGNYFTYYDIYTIGRTTVKINFADSITGYRKISMVAGESGYILAKLKPLKNEFNFIDPVLISNDFINRYKKYVAGYKSGIQLYGLVLSGVLLMMILFMITSFIINKKQEFIYNALYSICMFLLVFFNSVIARIPGEFSNIYYSYLDFFLLVTGIIFYILFARKFLDTKNNYVLLEKILKNAVWFILILLGIYTILNFFTKSYIPQFYLENLMKLLILALGLVFIIIAIKQKNKLLNYIAAGNAMMILFSAISLAIIFFSIRSGKIYHSALFYYYIGIIFELSFFLVGLNYKNRNELISNIKEQEALKLEAKKKEFETQIAVIKAQQEERNRISADMHDDLGAGMTTISLYSELAKSKLRDNPIPEIEKISTSANELLNKMNAIIWSMSSSNDSLSNMIAYIRSYAQEYFENTGITCRINLPENLPNIEVIGEIRRNVFMVVKEALNNILKHAKATEVNITLVRVEDGLTLFIHDNGKGINLDTLRQFGNGLKNMKKRMNDIQVEFSIENNNGTLITLHRKISSF